MKEKEYQNRNNFGEISRLPEKKKLLSGC